MNRQRCDLLQELGTVLTKATALVLLAALPAGAQIFSFGIKGGIPLTNAYSLGEGKTGGSAYNLPYTIGPTAEVHLPFHFSIEADALYRRNGFTQEASIFISTPPFTNPAYFRSTLNDWQFPVLGKLGKSFGPVEPFVDAGPVYHHVSLSGSAQALDPLVNANGVGIAVGGGITFKLPLIRVSPEIRYTRWPNPPYGSAGSSDQADFLVGITF